MLDIMCCGTCKNHPENKNRDKEKCEPCIKDWMASYGESMPNWEDAQDDQN